jgi:lipooligosaccharide transport system permease protein
VPAALLIGFAFGGVAMAATSYMRTWQDFDLAQLVILPLFLFSGTFYPIDAYPEGVRLLVQLTPLYQGVDLLRSLVIGHLDASLIVHVVYLSVMGIVGLTIVARRLDKLLLK